MPLSETPRLGYFLYTEPWQSQVEERRLQQFIDQAYEAIEATPDDRRRSAYHVVMSANHISTVILGMN